MTSLTIKNLTLDSASGHAAVCAPLMGKTAAALHAEIELVTQAQPDIIEWRADHFEDIADATACTSMLQLMHEQLPDMPVLFTLRTASEGGAQNFSPAVALRIFETAICCGHVDIIDTESANDSDFVRSIIETAHTHNVKVILSRHYFQETPSFDTLIRALTDAQALSPDIVKLAVMPQSSADVLALLHTAEAFRGTHANVPFITISMGTLGAFTRVVGGSFGSVLTYASLDETSASAPGQLTVADIRTATRLLSAE